MIKEEKKEEKKDEKKEEITKEEDKIKTAGIEDGDYINAPCPWCDKWFTVHKRELNCRIFRCSDTLSPHAPKRVCDEYTVNGCGKPFQMRGLEVLRCGYI